MMAGWRAATWRHRGHTRFVCARGRMGGARAATPTKTGEERTKRDVSALDSTTQIPTTSGKMPMHPIMLAQL